MVLLKILFVVYLALLGKKSGYNLRNTSPTASPGPFDQETQDSFEVGVKTDLLDGRVRVNAAVFYTTIDDMQREVNQADPFAGVVQVIKNTADADIWGFEIDGTFALGSNTVLTASLGWVDPSYKTVRFDLNGDGVIDGKDKALKLPRAAEWTYSVGLNHDWLFNSGSALSFRVNYAYRDDSFYTDNNLGFLLSQDILDIGLDYAMANQQWVFSLYGKNLLDEVNFGNDTQLPDALGPVPLGGTFSPVMPGIRYGAEVTYNFF